MQFLVTSGFVKKMVKNLSKIFIFRSGFQICRSFFCKIAGNMIFYRDNDTLGKTGSGYQGNKITHRQFSYRCILVKQGVMYWQQVHKAWSELLSEWIGYITFYEQTYGQGNSVNTCDHWDVCDYNCWQISCSQTVPKHFISPPKVEQ